MAQEFNAVVPESIYKMMKERGYNGKSEVYITDLLSWLYDNYNTHLDIYTLHTDFFDDNEYKENQLCWAAHALDITSSSEDGSCESFSIDNDKDGRMDSYYKENMGQTVYNNAVYTSYVECVLGTATRVMILFDQ